MAKILHIWSLSKTFPGQVALQDATFDVEEGEVHALVGQNGSGKSTLIKVLAGFHQPDAGHNVTMNDEVFNIGSVEAAHAAGIRFVHQDLGLVEAVSAVENLALGFGYKTSFGRRINWKKETGIKIFSINNEGKEFNDYRIKTFGLHRVFDAFVSSCEIGFSKPDPSIFKLALGIAQEEPQNCLYFDDRAIHVSIAKHIGLNAHIHESFEKSKSILESLIKA